MWRSIALLVILFLLVGGITYWLFSSASSVYENEEKKAATEKTKPTPPITPAVSMVVKGKKLIKSCMSGDPDCRIEWDHAQTIETSKSRVLVKFTESGEEKLILFSEFMKRDLSNFEPMELKFETVSGKQPDVVEIYQNYK